MGAKQTPAIVLALLTLMLGAWQCLAACVADDCSSALPPCHQPQHQQHHQHSTASACAQDFQLGERTHVGSPVTVGVVEVTSGFVPRLILSETLASPALSPPNLPLATKSVLRI
jgi:hypothetical protein